MSAHDPRVRVREALRALVQADPEAWDRPSLVVFRNRLLDETGSDVKPFAELLLEALQRGWRDRLPTQPVDESWWDALSGPFVMQWASERFVQAEMARWAVECWAYAFGIIGAEALRIAPPPRRHALAPPDPVATATRAGATAAARSAASAPAPSPATGGTRRPQPATAAAPRGGAPTAFPVPPRARPVPPSASGAGVWRPWRPPVGSRPGPTGAARGSWGSATPILSSWQVRSAFGVLIAAVLGLAVRVAVTPAPAWTPPPGIRPLPSVADGRAGTAAASGAGAVTAGEGPAPASGAGVAAGVGAGVGAGAGAGASAVGTADGDATATGDRAPAGEADPPADPAPLAPVVIATDDGQVMLPGVPSITGRVLPMSREDSARIWFVEPRQRATGTRRPQPARNVATPPAPAGAAPGAGAASRRAVPPVPGLDEVRLENGVRMRGRVEIIRAGTVVFRDADTGLRHEFRKEEIDEILTEFGTPVRFRSEAPAAPLVARAPSGPDIRGRGVGGRYLVRYEAPVTTGSPECRELMARPPNTVDVATVTHVPGADTLVIAFDGGDRFPSNIDAAGYFASTFRIMPDQARTSTALTTRLNGRFEESGTMSLVVSVILYRRTRGGGAITCNATVKAIGTR